MSDRFRGWVEKTYIEPISKLKEMTSLQSVVMAMLTLWHGIFLTWTIMLALSGPPLPNDTLSNRQFALILAGIILLTGCAMVFGLWSRVVINVIAEDGSVAKPGVAKTFGWAATGAGAISCAIGVLFLISLFPNVLLFSFWAFLCSTLVGIIAAYEGQSALLALKE